MADAAPRAEQQGQRAPGRGFDEAKRARKGVTIEVRQRRWVQEWPVELSGLGRVFGEMAARVRGWRALELEFCAQYAGESAVGVGMVRVAGREAVDVASEALTQRVVERAVDRDAVLKVTDEVSGHAMPQEPFDGGSVNHG